jgi:hypothetical protein
VLLSLFSESSSYVSEGPNRRKEDLQCSSGLRIWSTIESCGADSQALRCDKVFGIWRREQRNDDGFKSNWTIVCPWLYW